MTTRLNIRLMRFGYRINADAVLAPRHQIIALRNPMDRRIVCVKLIQRKRRVQTNDFPADVAGGNVVKFATVGIVISWADDGVWPFLDAVCAAGIHVSTAGGDGGVQGREIGSSDAILAGDGIAGITTDYKIGFGAASDKAWT